MGDDAVDDPFGWVGQVLEKKYRIDAAVGEGGFGIVYYGRHLGFDEAIAIKCLKLDALDPSRRGAFLDGFNEEGKLLFRLSNASADIVRPIDLGASASPIGAWTPYLVLEWIKGVTLAAHLKERPAMALREAMRVLEPAVRALDVAHQEGVAHRDVKPSNLMLTERRGQSTVKVLDFGVAKVMGDVREAGGALTATGPRAFTLVYAAPEQLDRRYGATGPWTDVFALTLVLEEMIAGRRVLDGSSDARVYARCTDPAERPTLRALGVSTSDEVEQVLQRALAVDPRNRYARAGEWWTALQDAVNANPAAAPVRATSLHDGPRISTVAQAPLAVAFSRPPMPTPSPTPAAAPSQSSPRRAGKSSLLVALLVIGVTIVGLTTVAASVALAPTPTIPIATANDTPVEPNVSPPVRYTACVVLPDTPWTTEPANRGDDIRQPSLPRGRRACGRQFPNAERLGDDCWCDLAGHHFGWAKAECDEAWRALEQSPSPSGVTRAHLLFNEGLLACQAGEIDRARACYEESLRHRRADERAPVEEARGLLPNCWEAH